MQISQISAENFLSFGVGDDGFVLDLNTREESESSAVTVLTGANGSGKTNVIRVLQQILDALRNPSDLLSDLRFSYHRTQIGSDEKPVRLDLAHKPSKLTMVCHFDKDEQTLLSDWWRMACGSGENLERLDSETAQSAAPLPQPLAQYGEWVLRNMGKEPLPIFNEIRIEVIANDPDRTLYGQQSSQILGWLSDDVVLDFRDNRLVRSTEIDNYQQSRDSLSRTMARLLPDDQQVALAHYLSTEDPSLPELSPSHFRSIPSDFVGANASIDHGRVTSRPSVTIHEFWVDLTRRCGKSSNQALTLSDVFKKIIIDAVVFIDQREISVNDKVDDLWVSPLAQLLGNGHLAAYLLRLKNGPPPDRERFVRLQTDFRALSGSTLDVTLQPPVRSPSAEVILLRRSSTPAVQFSHPFSDNDPFNTPAAVTSWEVSPTNEERPASATAIVISDFDLPLSQAGSGKLQLARWLAAMQAPSSCVIVADEPDVHFHPTLAAKVAQQLAKASAQCIVVSHSPYMIPSGSLENIRHITGLNGTSHASKPMDGPTKKLLAIAKKGLSPDDRLFLYARVVTFVEGDHDTEVLRPWINRWARKHCAIQRPRDTTPYRPQDLLNEFSVYVHACHGKNQVGPLMALANYLMIPCLGVWDADVLSSKSAKKKSSKNNQDILDQWYELGLIDHPVQVDNTANLANPPSPRMFFIGDRLTDSLEILFKRRWTTKWDTGLNSRGYHGPVAFRKWAETFRWPSNWEPFLNPLFSMICELATGTSLSPAACSHFSNKPILANGNRRKPYPRWLRDPRRDRRRPESPTS